MQDDDDDDDDDDEIGILAGLEADSDESSEEESEDEPQQAQPSKVAYLHYLLPSLATLVQNICTTVCGCCHAINQDHM